MSARALLLATALAALGGPARAQASFPLVPAASLSSEGDVLVTVPLSDATLDPAFVAAFAERFGAGPLAVWPLRSTDVLCLVLEARGEGAEALSRRIRADPDVLTAEPIREYRVSARSYPDALVPIQDALPGMNVLAAHEVSTGAGVRVAVIDTGVDVGHPDLADRAVAYADFVRVAPAAPAPAVGERHGTGMAALIAADARNGLGIVGVAPDAEILALRACWEEDGADRGVCNSFSLARALNVAILRDAHVLNLSLEGPPDPLLTDLIETALAQGRSVVAAAGSGGAFPASVPGVIAAGQAAGAVHAPDEDVISAVPGGAYDFFSGSSVAAAHVSGVVALIRSHAGAGTPPRDIAALLVADPDGTPVDACRAMSAGDGEPTCP